MSGKRREWWAMTGSNCRPSRCKRDALPTELIAHSLIRRQAKDTGRKWWAMTGSNCRPSRCKRDALPTELIAHSLIRRQAKDTGRKWWAMTGSNCRPSRCKRDALPTELIARTSVVSALLRLNGGAVHPFFCNFLTRHKKKNGHGKSAAVLFSSVQTILLVYSVLETLASLEFRLFGSRDVDFFARAWVAAFSSSTLCYCESTEAYKTNFATTGQSAGNGVKYSVYCFTSISFGQVSCFRNLCDQIIFIQGIPL